jgi:hypothetical protein
MHPDPLPPASLDPVELTLHQAELAALRENPWRASLFMRRLDAARTRLAELRAWLASLPRRLRRGWARRLTPALPSAALLLALASWAALAGPDATITVDTAGSGCTLADAITAANTDTATGSCGAGDAGADTIDFATANSTYGYITALPDITTPITIQGNGNTTIERSGGPAFSVLSVPSGGSLHLANATISGGSAARGAGIYASASIVNLTSATISGNSASDRGAGIYARSSTVRMTESTISGNTASNLGGGIASLSSTLSVTSATISGNMAGDLGGGIFASGTTAIENATLSGNSAYSGGALWLTGQVNLVHATITNNSAVTGGGINSNTFALVNVLSSIVAGQAAGADCITESGGTITSGGYNIESATSCGFTGTGDQQSVTALQLDLGPLAPNAPGTTQTHALGAASFALDEIPPGTNGCGTTVTGDQRGISRPQGTNCDVGAYELAVATPTPTPTNTPMPTAIAPTAAQVLHFAAAPDPTGRIRLTWETASEADVLGFRLERAPADPSSPQSPPGRPLPQAPWAPISPLIPARGSATSGTQYTMLDSPGVGSFAYRLVVVHVDGPPAEHGPAGAVVQAMRAFLPVGWR